MANLMQLYIHIRRPRNFLIFLCLFIGVTLALHFCFQYDPDWGATNLMLSIEASTAGAVLMMVADESSRMQKAAMDSQRDMIESTLKMSLSQDKALRGILLIAEAQRDMLLESSGVIRSIKEIEEKILSAIISSE